MTVFTLMNELPRHRKVFLRYRGVTFSVWPEELVRWGTYSVRRIEGKLPFLTIEIYKNS